MPPRSVKMKRFIFGFQRRVWWPKWTPASSKSFMATAGIDAPFSVSGYSGRRASRGSRREGRPPPTEVPPPGRGRSERAHGSRAGASEEDDRAERVAPLCRGERLVDLLERKPPGDELGELQPPLAVELDEARYVELRSRRAHLAAEDPDRAVRDRLRVDRDGRPRRQPDEDDCSRSCDEEKRLLDRARGAGRDEDVVEPASARQLADRGGHV